MPPSARPAQSRIAGRPTPSTASGLGACLYSAARSGRIRSETFGSGLEEARQVRRSLRPSLATRSMSAMPLRRSTRTSRTGRGGGRYTAMSATRRASVAHGSYWVTPDFTAHPSRQRPAVDAHGAGTFCFVRPCPQISSRRRTSTVVAAQRAAARRSRSSTTDRSSDSITGKPVPFSPVQDSSTPGLCTSLPSAR